MPQIRIAMVMTGLKNPWSPLNSSQIEGIKSETWRERVDMWTFPGAPRGAATLRQGTSGQDVSFGQASTAQNMLCFC